MKKSIIIITLILSSIETFSQSMDGGYGQGLVNLVPDKGIDFNKGFENIKPDGSLGFWRLKIVPERVLTMQQDLMVAFEFSIDKPTTIRGYNVNGGEALYDPSDFKATISGSMDFVIEGQYTDPITGKQHTFENKRDVSVLGNSTIKGGLFGWGGEVQDAVVKLKINQEGNPLETFLSKFKVKITSIEAVSRQYRGFSDIDYELGKRLEQGRKEIELNNILADAQNAETFGRINEAIGKYEELYALTKDPVIKAKIEELKAKQQTETEKTKAKAKAETEAKNDKEAGSDKNGPEEDQGGRNQEVVDNFDHTIPKQQLSTELDFWGNPIASKTEDGEAKTVSYAGMEVENNEQYRQQMELRQNDAYAREQHQLQEAENRHQVDEHNNAIYQQGNDIYQNSLNIESDFEEAKSQLDYGSGDALLNSSAALASSATNVAQAKTGLAGMGVSLIMKMGENAAKRKAAEEARAERERQRKEEEARIKAAKETLKNTRLKVFQAFPAGELPLSSTKSSGNNLYYFVYSYNDNQLTAQNPAVAAIPVFAIGKYPDGTWPLQTKIETELNALIPSKKTICGPFYSSQEAVQVFSSFSNLMSKTQMQLKPFEYKGYNAHPENNQNMPQKAKVDFWGNPIEN